MADVDMVSSAILKTCLESRANGTKGDDWAARSVEGWIVIVTGVNEEATEEDLQDLFGDYGTVKNLSIPLNRRTGFVMGYALLEFATKEEAEKAIKGTNETTFLEQTIHTDFAFSKGPAGAGRGGRAAAPGRRSGRDRSNSPSRR